MHGAAQGQPITQAAARLNARERSGARTLKGLSRSSSGLPGAPGGAKRMPIETPRRRRAPAVRLTTAKRVGGVRAKPGRGFRRDTLEGRNPREQPVAGALILCLVARDSRKGQSPETAARWAGPSLRRRDNRREKRYAGSSARKRVGYLPRGESSEG
jgi:hypothetical protein